MPDNLKNALIRVYTMDMRRNHGNVVVAEILFRRVDVKIHGYTANVAGAVLIDAGDALQPIADMVQRAVGFLVFIRSTDALVWVVTRADMGVTGYWTVEMIPWIDHLRAISRPDDDIIREAHR